MTGIPLRNGVYSFYLDGTSNDGTIIRSRENSQSRPVLRVVGRKNPTPTSCVSWDTPSQVGSLPSPPSGTVFGSSLTASHLNVLSGNYYTMGDGGSPPDFGRHNFYEISNTGFLRTEYAMFDGNGASLNAFDAEDIQIGPGPEVVTDYVYIGDIGDNGRQRGTGIKARSLSSLDCGTISDRSRGR